MDVVVDGLKVMCLMDYHGSQCVVSISACLNHRRENGGGAGILSWYVQKAAGSLVSDMSGHTALLVARNRIHCEVIFQMTKSIPEWKTRC